MTPKIDAADAKACGLCGSPPKAVSQYMETGGGDGRMRYALSCEGHPHATVLAATFGPHGYPQKDDEFKTNEAAIRAALSAWASLRPKGAAPRPHRVPRAPPDTAY